MKKWFTSLKGVIFISAAALLVFTGYAFIEMHYFLGDWITNEGTAMLVTVVLLLIVGGWLRALFMASGGRRTGLIALFVFCIFILLIAIYDMQYVLFSQIPWPEKIMVIAILVFGIVNTIVVAIHFRQTRKKS